ncbi:MAG: hypothetical protein IJD86_03420, partial [Clostridia bacterium]|nr:hypothetical protein [Clostridia bacterium]
GAPLSFDGESGKLMCAACGNEYHADDIDALNGGSETKIEFQTQADTFAAGEISTYVCASCGAELLTEETTTATECPYCSSPIVLNDKIEGSIKPELVVPFTVKKEEAVKLFEEYFKGKKLMPNIFLKTRNRISEIKKLYVPYWLFDCDAYADIVFNAEKVFRTREGNYEVTRIRHYRVHRAGGMAFENIPVDGSVKLDNRISESLEPYDLTKAVPFQPAVLSGALADHADANAAECEARAVRRVENSMESKLRSTVHGYTSVITRSKRFYSDNGKAKPVLMPVWLITTEKEVKGEKKVYTFAVNGQTGKLTCDVPAAKGKAAGWFFGVFGASFAVLYAIVFGLKMAGVI